MTRTLTTLVAAAVLIVGCAPGDVEDEPAVDPTAVMNATAAVYCDRFFDWSNRVTNDGLTTQTAAVDAYIEVNTLADDAAGTDVADELADVVAVINAASVGDAGAHELNTATAQLLAACHAVGWTSQ